MNEGPAEGDRYIWYGIGMEVLSVGRKYATLRVTPPDGISWEKKQPMPFPDTFVKVSA